MVMMPSYTLPVFAGYLVSKLKTVAITSKRFFPFNLLDRSQAILSKRIRTTVQTGILDKLHHCRGMFSVLNGKELLLLCKMINYLR
jgi:hypothetical protein